jgi:anthranilate synthase component 1
VDDLDLPDAYFIITDTILIFDHINHTIKVVSNAHVSGDPDEAYNEAVEKIDQLTAALKAATPVPPSKTSTARKPISMRSNFTRRDFEGIVRRAKEYIKAGDIFQVVLSQRFSRKIKSPPINIYRALRCVNPSPYMFYISLGSLKLVGTSPELLVRVEDGVMTLRPIAGTRRRGKTPKEDHELEIDLLSDEKELAEHIMLVDLGRNDVGRVCKYGTVRPTEMKVIERYSHVMHIVSNVEGRLRRSEDLYSAVRAAFPMGTVSGAPKIRAMEIIEELEPTRRGPYGGAVGYVGFSGNFDSCITIRTLIIKDNVAYLQAGAGIVADSVPSREHVECKNKARALVKAIELAEQGFLDR